MKTNSFFVQRKRDETAVVVRYLITTPLDPKTAAIKLCKEQSLSNALGDDPRVIKRNSAKYFPASFKKRGRRQFEVKIAYPYENHENSLSIVLSAAGGDTYNIKNLYPIKILSIELPQVLIEKYEGPRFGVEGLRKKLKVFRRPLLIGPVKPCVGMRPKEFANEAKEALLGGADIVKDDELISDPVYSPLAVRVKAVSKAAREVERMTGEKKMYFSFLGNGAPSRILENAKIAKKNGADGFMISPAINGWEIIRDLRKFGLPIVAHNAYVYSAHTKDHGISFSVFGLFQRLCGADLVVTPAPYGTFEVMSREEHLENIRILLKDIPGITKSFPAFCGGQSPKSVPFLRKDVGSKDFAVIAGTSLYDHPDGPAAGARILRRALDK